MAEKLALMKPFLEAGMPIKGVVVVLENGQPVQRPVEFIMGRETRIDAADDGIYIVMPSLNPDGSVKYGVRVLRKDVADGREVVEKLPSVIQTPWGAFALGSHAGRVVGFDPDLSEP